MVEGVSETIENEAKEQKGGFDMILGTLAASLLGNMLPDKGKIPAQVVIRAGQDF